MARPVKATPSEIRQYAATGPLYPLTHWVKVDGVRCAVEGLFEGQGGVNYEVMLPAGFHARYEGTHSLLCYDLADVRERSWCVVLEPCTDECRRHA